MRLTCCRHLAVGRIVGLATSPNIAGEDDALANAAAGMVGVGDVGVRVLMWALGVRHKAQGTKHEGGARRMA